MLGYKIYFDGTKFVAEDKATEVQSMPCDSTFSWFYTKTFANNAIKKNNAEVQNVKKCKQCGEYFWQKQDERQWFIDRKMKIPCRCFSCRKKKNVKN